MRVLFALVRLWLAFAVPSFLVSYGYALFLLYQNVAFWVWIIAIAANATAWLGLAHLLDTKLGSPARRWRD